MKPKFNPCAALPPSRAWRPVVCLIIGMLLGACGGQGSTNTNTGTSGDARAAPPNQGQPGAAGSPATVMAGAYGMAPTPFGEELVSYVWTQNGVTSWMALYMPSSKDPDYYPPVLYRGVVSLQTNGAALAEITSFDMQYKLKTGTAAVSAASSSAYQMALKGVDLTDAGSGIQFTATALATSAEVNREWTGTWADAGPGGSIKTSARLSVQNGKGNTDFGNCDLGVSLAQQGSAKPYFLASVALASAPGKFCARAPSAGNQTTLSGIAFIHDTVVGSATVKRLEIMLTDASGSGISFRGDHP